MRSNKNEREGSTRIRDTDRREECCSDVKDGTETKEGVTAIVKVVVVVVILVIVVRKTLILVL